MRPDFLGDSFDIVKHCLISWLASMGPWATHPMFTERMSRKQTMIYADLLGTQILSRKLLTREIDRDKYLASARECDEHVFLDPDTGLRLGVPTKQKKAPFYLFGSELVAIASARPKLLTLVYDQSLARGKEREQLQRKLSTLADQGVYGVAYVSHASFVLVGRDQSLVKKALHALTKESCLPQSRFLVARRRQRTKKGKVYD